MNFKVNNRSLFHRTFQGHINHLCKRSCSPHHIYHKSQTESLLFYPTFHFGHVVLPAAGRQNSTVFQHVAAEMNAGSSIPPHCHAL